MYKKIAITLTTAFLVSGCGGGDSSSQTSTSTITGQFIDAPVAGLEYKCSSGTEGVTDLQGYFTCKQGDSVAFSINGLFIGSASAQSLITPITLAPDNNTTVINIAQLIQTLDSDNNPSNGITIDANATEVQALKDVNVSMDAVDFDSVIKSYIGKNLVDEATANTHFLDSMAKIKKDQKDQTTTQTNSTAKKNYEYMTYEEYEVTRAQFLTIPGNPFISNCGMFDANESAKLFNDTINYEPLSGIIYRKTEGNRGWWKDFVGLDITEDGVLKEPRITYTVTSDSITGPTTDGYQGIGHYTMTDEYLDYDSEDFIKFSKVLDATLLNKLYPVNNFKEGDEAQYVYFYQPESPYGIYLQVYIYFNESAVQSILKALQ